MSDFEVRRELGAVGAGRFTRAYGLAHFGKSLFWYASEILFAFFLTEVAGIAPRQMGIVLAVGLLSGALADIVIGFVMRHRLSSAFKAGKLQVLGAVMCGAVLILLFFGPLVPEAWRFIYVLLTGLGFRIAYCFYDIPQNALLSLATPDDDSRTRVASLRLMYSGLASLAIAAALAPLLASGDADAKTQRFLWLALGMSGVALLTAGHLWRAMPKVKLILPPPPVTHTGFLSGIGAISAPVWIMIAFIWIMAGAGSTFSKIEPYYASYVLKSPFWGGVVIMAMSVGVAVSQPLWSWLSLRRSRLFMMILCLGLLIIMAGLFLVFGRNPVLAMILGFGFGAANGGVGAILWAAFSDSVVRGAKGHEGLAYGLLTAAVKISLAFGGLLIGEWLSRIDYRDSQSEYLMTIMTVPPILGAMIACGLMVLWARQTARVR